MHGDSGYSVTHTQQCSEGVLCCIITCGYSVALKLVALAKTVAKLMVVQQD